MGRVDPQSALDNLKGGPPIAVQKMGPSQEVITLRLVELELHGSFAEPEPVGHLVLLLGDCVAEVRVEESRQLVPFAFTRRCLAQPIKALVPVALATELDTLQGDL